MNTHRMILDEAIGRSLGARSLAGWPLAALGKTGRAVMKLGRGRRLATLLGGAPVTVIPGAATFAMVPCYPDVLRHAAALPEHPARGEQRAF